jgi:hypothetical protein
MAGSAIKHDELFDFNTFQKAIEEAKASTIDLANQLNKVAGRTNDTLSGILSQVSGKKMEIIPEKELSKLQAVDKALNDLGSSASNSRDIIAGLDKVNIQAADSISYIEAEAKALTKQYKSLSEEERNNAEIGGKFLKQLAEMKAATVQYNETVRNATKSVAVSEDTYQSLSLELSRMKSELKAMPGAFDPVTGKLNESNKEAVKLAQQISQTDDSIKKMDKSMGEHFRNVGNYTETEISLKQQLKEIVAEMARMKLAGEDNTEAYRNLAERAGELKDTLGDVAAEVKRVGSDTSTIEGLVGIMEGVAGAAATAEGAMQLFGVENDEVAESIRKLQAVQTVLMGIQSVANVLQKESAATLLIVNAQQKLHILYTQLQGAAESKNIIIRKTAAAAQWVLNAAMSANPAGILIVTIAALATGILLLTRRHKDEAEQLEIINRLRAQAYEWDERSIEILKMAASKKQEDQQRSIDLAKQQGKSQLEIMNMEVELAKKREDNARKIRYQFDTIDDNANTLLALYEKQRIEVEKLELVTDKSDKKQSALLEQRKTAADLTFKRLQNVLSATKDYADAQASVQQKELERQKLINEIALRDKKATIESGLSKVKEASLQELNYKIQLLENEKQRELLNTNLTQKERKAVIDKDSRQEADLRKAYNERIKKEELDADIALLQSQVSLTMSGSNEMYEAKEKLLDKEYEAEKYNISISLLSESDKNKKLKALYNQNLADKKELERDKRLAELDRGNDKAKGAADLEILKNQELIASSTFAFQKIGQARLNIEKIQADSIQREFDLNQKKYNEGLISHDEYEKQKTQITIDQENLRLAKIQEAAQMETDLRQGVVQTLSSVLDSYNQISSDASDYRISLIEKEEEISVKNAGDNAAAKEQIERQYNMRIVAEKRKQAKQDKNIALFQAGIGTANAVVNALQTKPFFPLGLAMAVLAGVMGGAQMFAIASKPLPQFRRGTMNAPEGPAIVNDEPGSVFKEIVMSGNTLYMPQKRNQVVNLKRGDKVFPAFDTKRILQNAELANIFYQQTLNSDLAVKLEAGRKLEVEHIMTNAMLATRTNEKEIGNEVGKHLKELPIEQHTWDDRGYRRSIRTGNTRINLHNDKNSNV